MDKVTSLRRATSAAQALLRETDSSLIIDGKPGTYTTGVYRKSSPALQTTIDQIVRSLGFSGGFDELNVAYIASKRVAESPTGSNVDLFDLQVVPAIVRVARERGVDPIFPLTQLCLESGYGRSSPRGDDGKPSYNYAGLKWNSVSPRTARKATARTGEVMSGKAVTVTAEFAAFNSGSEFANAYFDYLLSGPSSYRYKGLLRAKSATEYGTILQKGGYATDPNYAKSFAATAQTVTRKYAIA